MSPDHAPLLLERPPHAQPRGPAVAPSPFSGVRTAWFVPPRADGIAVEAVRRIALLLGLCTTAAVIAIAGWTVIVGGAKPFVTPDIPADPGTTFLQTTYTAAGGTGPVIVGDGVVMCTADLLPDHTAVTGALQCEWAGFAAEFPGRLDYTFAQTAHLGYTVVEGEFAVVATAPDGTRLESRSGLAPN